MAELTERVRKLVMESVGEERYKHSVRVAQTCARLCERFGLNEQVGFFVGIAHDMCKDMGEAELLETASRDGNPILKIEKSRPALLHGRAAAVLLKEDWGVDDPEILEAVANHIPEAVVFEMTELISQKKINSALSVLSELLADKNNEPIMMLAVLGRQMRQLYAARLALDKNLGTKYVMEVCAMKYDYIASKLISAARGFTLPQLKRAVELCTETDYRMKSSGADPRELLKEAVLRIAAGETHAEG